MEQDVCPICRSSKSVRITQKLARGQLQYHDVERQFGMSKEDVEEHVYKHSATAWEPADATTKAYDRDYYVKKLESIHDDLSEWLEGILEQEPTAENIRLATSLVKELRDTLRLLGEVTKVLKDDEARSAIAAVEEMRLQYLNLTHTISQQCCADCQKKVIAAIKVQRELLK